MRASMTSSVTHFFTLSLKKKLGVGLKGEAVILRTATVKPSKRYMPLRKEFALIIVLS